MEDGIQYWEIAGYSGTFAEWNLPLVTISPAGKHHFVVANPT